MTCRFTIDGQSYDFLVDVVDFSEPDDKDDQYIYADNSMEIGGQGTLIRCTVRGVFEQTAGPEVQAGELWRAAKVEAQSGNPMEFTPDTSRAFTIDLYPDVNRPPSRFYATRKGMAQREQALHWVSAKLLQPEDQQLKDLVSFQDSLQSQ